MTLTLNGRLLVTTLITITLLGTALGPAPAAADTPNVGAAAALERRALREGPSGTLERGKWTKVAWGWFVTTRYYVSGTAFPVTAKEYPLYREYQLPAHGGCVALNAVPYADIWLYSPTGGSYNLSAGGC